MDSVGCVVSKHGRSLAVMVVLSSVRTLLPTMIINCFKLTAVVASWSAAMCWLGYLAKYAAEPLAVDALH